MQRPQANLGEQDEYDMVDKAVDEVEQQLLDFTPDVVESAGVAQAHPPYTRAYPSPAIRKPRSFFNYMGEDTIPILDTVQDEDLLRLSGGSGATNSHELFVPLTIQPQLAAPPLGLRDHPPQ